MSHKTVQVAFFICLSVALFVLSFFVFKPYLTVLFLSSVLAVSFYPVYEKILGRLQGRKSTASFFTVLLILICIILPFIFLSAALLKEAVGLYNSLILEGGGAKFLSASNVLIQKMAEFLPVGTLDEISFDSYAQKILNWIIGHFDSLFGVVFGGLFNFILMLLSLYYLFMNGEKIKNSLIRWSPLSDFSDLEFLERLRSSVDAVVRGRLLVSLAQGLFLGIGFWIFGIGNPVLWGFVGGIASLVPILGTSIITIPAVGYLFLTGHIGAGIGLILWGVICVGLVDNILSFLFLKDKIRIHPLLILFSILGGVEIFGAIGFLVGPVALSSFFSVIEIYPSIFSYNKEVKNDGA